MSSTPLSPTASGDLPLHGGDLAGAAARFGQPAAGWLDLSTGVSPFPYPMPAIDPASWQRLPDAGLMASLLQAAAGTYGVPDPASIVAGAGSQAVIRALPRLRPPGKVAVVGPTYAEHAACWSAAGHQVTAVSDLKAGNGADVVVVVNPNNPDGRMVGREDLLAEADRMAATGRLLVVDEAFGDLVPGLSVAPDTRAGLVVLRSFGKFFGMAGLRLGFGLAEPALAERLRAELGPWPVSVPALVVGTAALSDKAWIDETRRRLRAEGRLLDRLLRDAGLCVAGGTDLFRLVEHGDAVGLYDHLGRQGILVRPFAQMPRWLRIGLPPGEEGRQRLVSALAGSPGR
ncbi:MAG: threonine-phosphate decarboxylase [Telmatospirillum sp.]|nr:threonine-phosphate decarboxylase [Telmatospirillum sp.]